MERLTDIEVIAGQVHPIPKLELQNPSGLEKIVSRLQEIEDILGDTYGLDRLRELVEADKVGRCVVLPCKVGDTVYLLGKNCVLENKVLQVSFNNSGDWVVFTDCKSLLFCKIGETAFITREAAEATLAKEADHE